MRDVYYEDTLRYLKEEGARFAQRHPQRIKYLNLESAKDRDPMVSALFEGFAFLCAGIRTRIDSTLPELAAGLTGLLWPQLLAPIPSICVIEFKPRSGMLQNDYKVDKGTALFADPDPNTGVKCQFATTHDVYMNSIVISKIDVATTAGGKDVLTIGFKIDQGNSLAALSPARIFINDDLPAALFIRKMLLRHVEEAVLRDDLGQIKVLNPKDIFIEAGFGEDEDLFPESQNVSRPFCLIKDYFAYPEKFLFVDIHGLDSFTTDNKRPSSLSLEIRFDRKISGKALITTDTFKLHCVPAVNVFRRDAEPILVEGRKCEYHVVPDASYPDCYAIHSIDSVTGIDNVTGKRQEYERYCKIGSNDIMARYYSTRIENYSEDRRVMLSMDGQQVENNRLKQETLHIETWQTNGMLARKILAGGGLLCNPPPNFPDYVTFTNLTIPTRPINIPPDDKYLWAFLSHTSATYSDFNDAEKLKEFLRVYDWTASGKRPEIESIQSVSIKPCDLVINRTVMRGTEMIICIDDSAIPEENIFLFGTVLAKSLSCMASINTFLKFVVTVSTSEKTFVWHCRSGERMEI